MPRIHNGERLVSSINGIGKTIYHTNKTRNKRNEEGIRGRKKLSGPHSARTVGGLFTGEV